MQGQGKGKFRNPQLALSEGSLASCKKSENQKLKLLKIYCELLTYEHSNQKNMILI